MQFVSNNNNNKLRYTTAHSYYDAFCKCYVNCSYLSQHTPPVESCELSTSLIGRIQSLVTARLDDPFAVFRIATRATPSFPTIVSVTRARGLFIGGKLSSFIKTSVPGLMFSAWLHHFLRCCNWVSHSVLHFFQNVWYINEIFCHRFNLGMLSMVTSGSIIELNGAPIKKCAGVSVTRSSGFSVSGTRGLELIIAEIWQTSVRKSSKYKIDFPTTL